MQPSNQQPPEGEQQAAEATESAIAASELIVPVETSVEHMAPAEASAEAIGAGLVYPPLPSFYENMQPPAARPPLPLPASGPQIAQPFAPPVPPGNIVFAPQTVYQPGPGMAPPPFPGAYPPPVRPRGSRKRLWIILSVVGVCLLAVCGLCGWGVYSFVAPIFQQTAQSVDAVSNLTDNYYQDLEQNDYSAAYAMLQMSGLTQESFTQQATQREKQLGSISSYQIASASPQVTSTENGADISGYTMTVNVVRVSSSYTANLNLAGSGNNWKITSFNTI